MNLKRHEKYRDLVQMMELYADYDDYTLYYKIKDAQDKLDKIRRELIGHRDGNVYTPYYYKAHNTMLTDVYTYLVSYIESNKDKLLHTECYKIAIEDTHCKSHIVVIPKGDKAVDVDLKPLELALADLSRPTTLYKMVVLSDHPALKADSIKEFNQYNNLLSKEDYEKFCKLRELDQNYFIEFIHDAISAINKMNVKLIK